MAFSASAKVLCGGDEKPGDHVRVSGLGHQQAAADNLAAASRRIG